MPIPGLFSAYYWPGDGIVGAAPPPTSGNYVNYPYWFNPSNISMTIQWPVMPRRFKKKLKNLQMKAWRFLPRSIQVWLLITKRVFSKDFQLAIQVVDEISVSPELRNMKSWNSHLAERIGQDPHVHENVSRALAAYDKLPESMPRSEKMLLIELAWTGRKNG